MRLALVSAALVFTGCVTIHTIDLGAQRSALGPDCNVPMNKGGSVPSGWSEIGRVQIDGATEWTDAQFAAEFRQQACDMGAEYVVVTGDPQYMEAKFLMQVAQSQPTRAQQQQPQSEDGYAP